jgi:hypothetical protein
LNILADCRNFVNQRFIKRFICTESGAGFERVNVGCVVIKHSVSHLLHESDEPVGLRGEVGFAVNFNHYADFLFFVYFCENQAFCGYSAGFLGSLREALFT